jgi:hypothetical protein
MGAHGIEAFQNDAAWDWFAKLAAGGPDLIPAALLAVADRPDAEIDMWQYSRAVAAAALVAAAIDAEAPPLYQDQMDWITRSGYQPAAETVALARRAIRTILGESEMKSLVMRSPHAGPWAAYMARLESSLRQPGP